MNYPLAYAIGFHPWEDAASDPAFVEKINHLFAREERDHPPPHGPALDIGTGSGIWGVALARRGWTVTGVEMQLIRGDVTALSESDVGSGYQLLLDTGTFHDLDEEGRRGMAAGIDRIAAPDATVLLLVWPRRTRPLIRGADREEVLGAFDGWEITDVEPSHFHLPKPLEWVLRPDEHWYRLRRA